MRQTLKMDSVSDFVHYFTDATFHAGVQDEIIDHVAEHKDNRIMHLQSMIPRPYITCSLLL
jgi:hypothetical protein